MVSTPLPEGAVPAPPGKVPRAVLEAVFARAPVGVAVVDLDGRYLWTNPAFCALVGVGPEHLVGHWYLGPVLREDWEANLAQGRRAVAGEIDAYDLDERLVRPTVRCGGCTARSAWSATMAAIR